MIDHEVRKSNEYTMSNFGPQMKEFFSQWVRLHIWISDERQKKRIKTATKWGWKSGFQSHEFLAEEMFKPSRKNEGLPPSCLSCTKPATQLCFQRKCCLRSSCVMLCRNLHLFKVLFWIFSIFHSLMYSRLDSNLQCCQQWPWASTAWSLCFPSAGITQCASS